MRLRVSTGARNPLSRTARAAHLHVLIVRPEVVLATESFDLFDLALLKIRQLLDLSQLLDALVIARRGDGHDPLSAAPQQEHRGFIDVAPSSRLHTMSDALKYGLERTAFARVAQDGRERAVRVRHNAVLFVDVEDFLQMRLNHRVVFQLVCHRLVLGVLEQRAQVLSVEIAHAERRGELALVLHVFKDLDEQ